MTRRLAADEMPCMEVRGGSKLASQSVEMGGLNVWVYSQPYENSESGGDIYYASSCATGRISRLLLADVSGHGHVVADMANSLHGLMRRYVNFLDQKRFVEHMNREFAAMSHNGSFATALVSTFFAPTGLLTLCNAGHPRPMIFRAESKQWSYLSDPGADEGAGASNIPLGILDQSAYEQFDVELRPGDMVVYYTDALIESRDAQGEQLDEKGLMEIMQSITQSDPVALLQPAGLTGHILARISARRAGKPWDDDVTVLILRANGEQPHIPFRRKFDAIGRFFKTALGSLNPRRERAPFPDFKLANVGGALIPAFNRLWRPRKPAAEKKAGV